MDIGELILYTVSYFGLFCAIFFLVTLIENRKQIKNPKAPKELPKVTIMVPACNEEQCLAKTVESLLELDYPKEKLQIIVIDDGSTDKTLKIARSYEKRGVLVLTKPNGGKGTALNLGLKHAKGEFVGCLDADSIVEPDALKKMIGYFRKKSVMAVTPSLKCTRPKTIWQRIQVIEFLLGVYLRKVFSYLGSIHVTPGPFTIFRKEFFDRYGGYDTSTCTEDIEIALRIQSNRYEIENAVDANVYAVAMPTFTPLKKQRVRWYKGFLENIGKYKHLFKPQYGNLGLFVLPSAFVSIMTAATIVAYTIYMSIKTNYQRAVNLYNVNFDIWRLIDLDWDWFYINQSPLMMIGLVSLVLGITMVYLAKRMSREEMHLSYAYILFMVFYLPLYVYWWGLAIKARIKNKDVGWVGRKRKEVEIKYA
ncbi:TPA: glycosyltransferase family 2 protein [Candidatus Woesearchaeota archaeon]|nr:glycosyltransferase family 2 protein [Candidatus Woesearchaeota archaeon]